LRISGVRSEACFAKNALKSSHLFAFLEEKIYRFSKRFSRFVHIIPEAGDIEFRTNSDKLFILLKNLRSINEVNTY
jgi:hypothetical protein